MQISKVRIIESLNSEDLKTGREIKEYCQFNSDINDIEYKSASTADGFVDCLQSLVDETQEDDCILLFLETHGSVEGIEIAGQSISWHTLNSYISKINERSACSLIAVFSCCFGINFYQQTDILNQAPYLLLFGVDKTISASTLLAVNKKISLGLFRGKSPVEIEIECNSLLGSVGVKLIHLDAEIFLYKVMGRFLLEAVDEQILKERVSSFIAKLRKENPDLTDADEDISKHYVGKLLSLENLENRFYDKKEKFLLTGKYFYLNERFTLDFDTLYDLAGIDGRRNALLHSYDVI